MTLFLTKTPESRPVLSPISASNPLNDRYVLWAGNHNSPDGNIKIDHVRWTHKEGYIREGIAKEEGLEDGYLPEAIDKSWKRKEGILFLLEENPEDSKDKATARFIDASTIEELATFDLVSDSLRGRGVDLLEGAIADGYELKELGALAKSTLRESRGFQELVRNLLQITVGKDILLYCSMVEPTRRALSQSLSPLNFMPIGETVLLEETDYRPETPLTPLIINPDEFLPNIYRAMTDARTDKQRQRLTKSALFFSHDLSEEYIPEPIMTLRRSMGL